jgi:hypothetical protein
LKPAQAGFVCIAAISIANLDLYRNNFNRQATQTVVPNQKTPIYSDGEMLDF